MTRFENWSFQIDLGQYKSPRFTGSTMYVCGNVYGHDSIPNGRRIKTSRIISLNLKDRIVRTMDGVYRLGRPDRWYIAWLKENNLFHKDLNLE